MNRVLLCAATALALAPIARADEAAPKRVIPTVTRTVQMFSTLENQWLDAVQQRDLDAARKIVADNFELRSAAAPGRPTPREESLKRSFADAPYASRIEQMAAHEYGELVVVSFLWKLDVAKRGPLPQQIFVIDTWKQGATGWQVVTRYAAPVGAGPNYVPGADLAAPEIKKKI